MAKMTTGLMRSAASGLILLSFASLSQAQFFGRGSGPEGSQGGSQGKQCSGHSGTPASREARLQQARRREQSRTASLARQTKPITIEKLQQPESPEILAARPLTLATELSAEARTASQNHETERASKLRDRVQERLNQILEKYSETAAAEKALALLKEVQDK